MKRRTNPSRAVVRIVRQRDNDQCLICGSFTFLSTQHRLARGMGGSRSYRINLPANLITLCGSGTTGCHGRVEASRDFGRSGGWRVDRHEDPLDVLVWSTPLGCWLRLDDDGSYEFADTDQPPPDLSVGRQRHPKPARARQAHGEPKDSPPPVVNTVAVPALNGPSHVPTTQQPAQEGTP